MHIPVNMDYSCPHTPLRTPSLATLLQESPCASVSRRINQSCVQVFLKQCITVLPLAVGMSTYTSMNTLHIKHYIARTRLSYALTLDTLRIVLSECALVHRRPRVQYDIVRALARYLAKSALIMDCHYSVYSLEVFSNALSKSHFR